MPSGLLLELGKMHGRLKRDLASFSPWMAKEKIKIYLYKTPESYMRGEFEPPAWSNGVAFYAKKLIATHEQPEDGKLHSVLAHEMSHLLFESFWAEERKDPPVWLNEGLAMLEEAPDPGRPESSDWHRAMWVLEEKQTVSFERFFSVSPARDMAGADKDAVSLWYVQAYSVVYFLYRRHTRLQFRNFCAQLREGKNLQQALWKAYRYPTLSKFEKEWRAWLSLPEVRALARSKSPRGSASASPPVFRKEGLKNVDFRRFHFNRLMPE